MKYEKFFNFFLLIYMTNVGFQNQDGARPHGPSLLHKIQQADIRFEWNWT